VCVCEVVAAYACKSFIAPKGNCEVTLNCVLQCVFFWVPYSFKIWIEILKERDYLEVIAFNGRKILKCILKK